MNENIFNDIKNFFLDNSVKIQEAIIKIDRVVFFTENLTASCMADMILFTEKNKLTFEAQKRKTGYKFSFCQIT